MLLSHKFINEGSVEKHYNLYRVPVVAIRPSLTAIFQSRGTNEGGNGIRYQIKRVFRVRSVKMYKM